MEIFDTSTTSLDVEEQTDSGGVSLDDVIQVFYLVFGILGLFGNGLVLLVMVRIRSLRTITNLFIINQSVIDFASSIFLLILLYNPVKYDFKNWQFNAWTLFVCYFWQSQYIFWSLMGCSTGNLIILTLERGVAVVFPIIYRNRVTWRTAAVFVVLPWIFGFVFQLYWPSVHHFVDGVCYPSFGNRNVQIAVGVIVFIFKLFIPVIVMFAVYVAILQRIKPKVTQVRNGNPSLPNATTQRAPLHAPIPDTQKTTKNWATTPAAGEAPKSTSQAVPQTHRIRLNIIKTLLLVTVVFAVCWTPTQLVFLVYNLGGPLDIRGTLYKLSVVVVFINIWINPVIYTFKYRKFQDGLRKTFCLGQRQTTGAPSTVLTLG
ncbi:Galanin receptor type 2 [Holothuria leucospilota]|uniref:Galanin receptor type 2 n=1 Tax=Holothuria leucospilota TaxID=206669 RepID=A0A9Q1H2Y9_HOLLE|nr:Galanin receptor type 2 [Holothuria leucospilota]